MLSPKINNRKKRHPEKYLYHFTRIIAFVSLFSHAAPEHSITANQLLYNIRIHEADPGMAGDSDYSTTANLYAHLDLEDSMLLSATMLNGGLFDGPNGAAKAAGSSVSDDTGVSATGTSVLSP